MPCGAKTRAGPPCRQPGMANGRCRMHGGSTPVGLAHPSTVTGRWSKDLPTRMAARYAEALSDGELIALRDELALTDARLSDLLGKVETGEAGDLWRDLRDAKVAFSAARGDSAKAAPYLAQILSLIDRGARDWMVWNDIGNTIERRRRIAETERKRLEAMQNSMTAEQAMLLLGAVVDTIRRHVTDREVLRGISSDLSGLLAREPR